MLLHHDSSLTLADFCAYVKFQELDSHLLAARSSPVTVSLRFLISASLFIPVCSLHSCFITVLYSFILVKIKRLILQTERGLTDMSSPEDIFGLGDDPGDEIFLSDEEEDENEEGPTRDGAGPSGDDEQPVDEDATAPVLSNRTMLRKLCFCFHLDLMLGNWVRMT